MKKKEKKLLVFLIKIIKLLRKKHLFLIVLPNLINKNLIISLSKIKTRRCKKTIKINLKLKSPFSTIAIKINKNQIIIPKKTKVIKIHFLKLIKVIIFFRTKKAKIFQQKVTTIIFLITISQFNNKNNNKKNLNLLLVLKNLVK